MFVNHGFIFLWWPRLDHHGAGCDWSSQPGLGESEMPGFAVDVSQSLPDLSKHWNLMAEVLQEDAQLYEKLSKAGVSSFLYS